MGMSASQVRFLSLQNRRSHIGRELSTLSNRKMALSRDMQSVSRKYTNALNQTKLKYSYDGGSSYKDLTYRTLMTPNQYNMTAPLIVTDAKTGKIVLNNDTLYDLDGNPIMYEDSECFLDMDNNVNVNTARKPLTYVTLARMISEYSHTPSAEGFTTGLNVGNHGSNNGSGAATAGGDGNEIISNIPEQYDYEYNVSKRTMSGNANPGAYVIPTSVDGVSLNGNLRMEMFQRLGLISTETVERYNNLMAQLYGSEAARNAGVYPVTCAMGKLNMAEANLQAFEAMANEEHNFTFSWTTDWSESLTYDGYNLREYGMTSQYNTNRTDIYQTLSDLGKINQTYDNKLSGTDMAALYESMGYTFNTTHNDYVLSLTSGDKGIVMDICVNSSGNVAYKYYVDGLYRNIARELNYTNADGEALIWGDLRSKLMHATTRDSISYTGISTTHCDGTNIDDGHSNNSTEGEAGHSAFDKALNWERSQLNILSGYVDSNLDYACNMLANSYYLDPVALEAAKQQVKDSLYAPDYLSTGASTDWGMVIDVEPDDLAATHYAVMNAGLVGEYFVASRNAENTYFYGSCGAIQDYTEAIILKYLDIVNGTAYCDSVFSNGDATVSKATVSYYTIGTNTTDLGTIGDATAPSGMSLGKATTNTLIDWDKNTMLLAAGALAISGVAGIAAFPGMTPILLTALQGLEVNTLIGLLEADGDRFQVVEHKEYYRGISGALTRNQLNNGFTSADLNFMSKINNDDIRSIRSQLQSLVQEEQERVNDLKDQITSLFSAEEVKQMDFYDALFLKIAQCGWIQDTHTSSETNSNSSEYLNNKLQNNDYMITECNYFAGSTGYKYTTKLASNVTKIYTVHDSSAENAALAEYEAERSLIQNKEQKIDNRMEKLETEQQVINTELQGIQKVIEENIGRTFKIFV